MDHQQKHQVPVCVVVTRDDSTVLRERLSHTWTPHAICRTCAGPANPRRARAQVPRTWGPQGGPRLWGDSMLCRGSCERPHKPARMLKPRIMLFQQAEWMACGSRLNKAVIKNKAPGSFSFQPLGVNVIS